jgi:hypothetical protein
MPTEPGWYWFVGSAVMRNVGDVGDAIVRFDEPTAMKVLPYRRGLWFRWGMGHESVTATDGIWSRIPDAPPIDEDRIVPKRPEPSASGVDLKRPKRPEPSAMDRWVIREGRRSNGYYSERVDVRKYMRTLP